MRNRCIIIVGQQPWDVEIGSNCKNIAIEFSKNNQVLYVNSPLDRITSIRQRQDPKIQRRLDVINKKEMGLIQIQKNLWNLYPDSMVESINWINNGSIFNTINKINNKRFANSIKKAIASLKFKDYILFNDNEIFKCFYLIESLKPALSIYYSRDYILATDYWKKHGKRLEPMMIAKSDICVANSTYLKDYCKQYNDNSFYVGQGCELELFDQKKIKSCSILENIGHPIIGFVGALIVARLDISIIEFIAKMHTDWNIVLVGPEDSDFKSSNLHSLKNVHFIGPVSPEALPTLINAFDICINPQIVNQLTIGNYPRKVDEYLALGKPVVATATKAMEVFKDFVYLAERKEEYSLLIQEALREDSIHKQDERRKFALSHSWENCVGEIYRAMNEYFFNLS